MKKRVCLFLFVFFSFFAFSSETTGKIAVFNTLRLGKSKKNYKMTASVIKDFDIIGLLEVMNRSGVEKLIKELEIETGKKWNYYLSPYPVGESSYKEYYAYIWQDKRVKFVKERGYYQSENKEFSREPYGVDFKIEEFDFTLVLVHIIFGKEERRRRGEIFKLNKVYDFFQNSDSNENDIIIAGDFNMSALDESFENLLNHKDKIICVIDPIIKTTLGKSGLSSSYDNMFLSTIHTWEFTGESGAVDFSEEKYKERKESISDHLPIFIEVEIVKDDD